jgi:hypothetical protein
MKKIINLTAYELIITDVYGKKQMILEPAEIPFEIFPSTQAVSIHSREGSFMLGIFASGISYIPSLPEETEETIYILDEPNAAHLVRSNVTRNDVLYFSPKR